MSDLIEGYSENDIAIVGLAARVPGARTATQYWNNLVNGVESTTFFDEETLLANGVSQRILKNPNYVRAGMVMPDLQAFDGEFFGLSPKESAIMDPQHRHFLECSWEALEDAGHLPGRFDGSIGVWGGCGMGSYFMFNILSNPDLINDVGMFLLRHTGNDKDFLATRVSYALNLTGPSVNVQTACSTSLVASHMACQSLLNFECDLALAGGVTIDLPHYRGYMYKEGEILSPDGHCRAFDHRSRGTIFGSGAGVVVLRRLTDALEDNDRIYAVIRGSAINNDGAAKVGYLAPSVDGQAAAVTEALAVADVNADTIDFVECHGTGTPVGDPIEVAALTRAYRETTERNGFCGLGSVKTNIGHLDTAAGVAGLIKTTLALHHKQIPPTINFEKPNPTIDFDASPFYVVDTLTPWPKNDSPARAGINSLGVGGTNAHLILQEAPPHQPPAASNASTYLFQFSARNRAALDSGCTRLADHLHENKHDLADVTHTLREGRQLFEHRRVLAASSHDEAIQLMRDNDPRRVFTHKAAASEAPVVFMFPGGGVQYPDMAKGLYETEPVFRQFVDAGLHQLQRDEGEDFRRLLFPTPETKEAVAKELERPALQLPLIFIVEYALARLWMSKGIEPESLIGHSLGENTAACVAGIFSFSDAIGLVSLRGKLFETLPEGGMLSLTATRKTVESIIPASLDLAVVNAPESCVVSGPVEELDSFAKVLEEKDIDYRRIRITVAAHSRMLESILQPFRAYLQKIRLNPNTLPMISNRTGTWMTPEQATSPDYWVEHLRQTVYFAEGMGTLLKKADTVFIEAGPGTVLSSLARQHPDAKSARGMIPSLRHPEDSVDDHAYFLTAIGRAWAAGAAVPAEALGHQEGRQHLSLPSYAFRHKNYWIESGQGSQEESLEDSLPAREEPKDWYYAPSWKDAPLSRDPEAHTLKYLIFADSHGLAKELSQKLRTDGHQVVLVHDGDAFAKRGNDFVLSPELGQEHYVQLLNALEQESWLPDRIIHLWMLTADESFRPGSSFFHRNQERGFYSLFYLAKAFGEELPGQAMHLKVAVNGMLGQDDEAIPYPAKATLLGPARIIPREFPGSSCTVIDIPMPQAVKSSWLGPPKIPAEGIQRAADRLYSEAINQTENSIILNRDKSRLSRHWSRQTLSDTVTPKIKEGGTYMITGGLGGVGQVMAQHLAQHYKANLLLITRPPFPNRPKWEEWLASHGSDNKISRRINAVKDMEKFGVQVRVASVDVADEDRLNLAVQQAERDLGPIKGVLHAAGVLRDGPIAMKRQSEVEEVFSPKVHGTLALDAIFKDASLDFFLVFSSTSTILAPAGQVDYVAANAFLNAYASSRRKTHGAVAINFGTWNQIGMTSDMGDNEKQPSTTLKADHPLFEEKVTDTRGNAELHAKLSTDHWILGQHRTLGGKALIPGTGYLEIARAALAEIGETRPFAVENLFFLRPLHVPDQKEKDMRVTLKSSQDGYTFSVQSFYESEKGWETHAEARLQPCGPPAEDTIDLAAINARCTKEQKASAGGSLQTKQFEHLQLGERWQNIRAMHFAKDEALATIELAPRFESDTQDYFVHPALLDMATGFPMELIKGYERSRELWVPVSYGQVRFYGRLTGRIYSWARNHGENTVDKDFATFDLAITDSDGKVLMEVDAFSVKKMAGDPDFDTFPVPSPADLVFDKTRSDGSLSPGEIILRHNVEQGIKSEDGPVILEKALSYHGAQVAVSPLDLDKLLEQTEKMSLEADPEGNKFARPDLENDYAAPENDMERRLVSIWENFLGVENIGVEDSFFELGGHSLIAVRLFAEIKKAFHVEFAISVLFEAPTIRRVTALIKEALPDEALGEQAPKKEVAFKKRHTHLVAMHAGTPGPKTPIFLVAGMFGNVLNLRHLAHLIGTNRPFYGLQARGLTGEEEPHTDFKTMAADYIAEIKSVQSEGPYIIGGFSGGGITALEMAQQLQAAGDQVGSLIMLDTPLPKRPLIGKGDRLKIHKQNIKEQGLGYLKEWIEDRIRWELAKRQPQEEAQLSPEEFQSQKIEAAFRAALDVYDLKHYSGTINLFRPKLDKRYHLGEGRVVSSEWEFVFDDNGWTPHVDGLNIEEVPGNHDSMVLEPAVRVLASRIAESIEEEGL